MENKSLQDCLRAVPSVNDIIELEEIKALIESYGRTLVLEKIQDLISMVKEDIKLSFHGGEDTQTPEEIGEYLLKNLNNLLELEDLNRLKRLVNGTGIVLHTNLGRAPLPKSVLDVLDENLGGYCNLEYDLLEGKRGSRHDHMDSLLREITGAEASLVVNNNAAAVFLCLNTFAKNKEVLVSRGQLVEIGGSFRIPDIIEQSGCYMVEVGTTNKTKIEDYERAISSETEILLKVHTSNYKITGFTQAPSLKEMASLAAKKDILFFEDLGSGCLVDLTRIGLPYESRVQDSVKEGLDLITFSGDKLLGGPQAGIIVGKRAAIEALKKNPLARAFRCDKTTISALYQVLTLYRDEERAFKEIPVLAMMGQKTQTLLAQAVSLKELIDKSLKEEIKIQVSQVKAEVGGGSLPGVLVESPVVSIEPINANINRLQEAMRTLPIPIIAPIEHDRILIHMRTLNEGDRENILNGLRSIFGEGL
ncbi:MAG: L-seryl-tRNA(Sec) selenium transferase [Anaerovoracaceae bacterium]|nr:L-seryl-tRNA(Sec) selenium transferase [Anaerovoracaceae bacterium]